MGRTPERGVRPFFTSKSLRDFDGGLSRSASTALNPWKRCSTGRPSAHEGGSSRGMPPRDSTTDRLSPRTDPRGHAVVSSKRLPRASGGPSEDGGGLSSKPAGSCACSIRCRPRGSLRDRGVPGFRRCGGSSTATSVEIREGFRRGFRRKKRDSHHWEPRNPETTDAGPPTGGEKGTRGYPRRTYSHLQ